MSFAGAHSQMDTTRYQNRPGRNLKFNKFAFGSLWLPYLLRKHWFTSSVSNFCRWVADVPQRETSPAARNEEKRLFSQAIPWSTYPKNPRLRTCIEKLATLMLGWTGFCIESWFNTEVATKNLLFNIFYIQAHCWLLCVRRHLDLPRKDVRFLTNLRLNWSTQTVHLITCSKAA